MHADTLQVEAYKRRNGKCCNGGLIMKPNKIPVSVLVVIHTPDGQVLLLERADRPGFWQSVTGSLDAPDEDPMLAAARELQEETGLLPADGELLPTGIQNRYEIYAHWRHRYGPGVTHNTEHVFHFVMAMPKAVRLAPREHLGFVWLPWDQAAARCFSPSNAEAIQALAARFGWPASGGESSLKLAAAASTAVAAAGAASARCATSATIQAGEDVNATSASIRAAESPPAAASGVTPPSGKEVS